MTVDPLWLWGGFTLFVLAMMALDLGVFHRKAHVVGFKEALGWTGVWVTLAMIFNAGVWYFAGPQKALEFLFGYLIEYSLSVDNIFVFALLFSYFAVPPKFQHRVLFWGILGVIVLRGIMIGLGATLVAQYGWVLYIFAAFLIFTGIKMLFTDDKEMDLNTNPVLRFMRKRFRVTETLQGNQFFVHQTDPQTGKLARYMTPLFLALVLVEIADLVFAVDSVPAVFAITTDPYIVYTSNIFAILGLRALYFALAAVLHRFHYLRYALAILLVFIGSKIFVADLLGWEKFPASWSLGITFAILATGVIYSLWRSRGETADSTAH